MRRVRSPSQNVTDEVGKLLRQKYDEILHEPLPRRLLALLDKLEMDATKTSFTRKCIKDATEKPTPQ